MFRTNPEELRDLLKAASDGELQLPDFQRSYVWDDSDVRGIIASLARGFPVGALLALETGGEVEFAPRPVEGSKGARAPRTLLLDGQQRITSLFQALWSSDPVRTRDARRREVDRHYYLDMVRAAEAGADIVDCIEGFPADRVRRSNFARDVDQDLSSREREIDARMFPLDRIFDEAGWWDAWNDAWGADGRPLRDSVKGILEAIRYYKMPVITLDRSNSREAICLVFEKVNVGGKKLDAFELVTAIFAASSFDLRADWKRRRSAMFDQGRQAHHILKGDQPYREIDSTSFLQVVTFLRTLGDRDAAKTEGKTGRELPQVSIKRGDLLALRREDYEAHADTVQDGFGAAARFLNARSVFYAKDVPYPPQRTALAALFAARDNRPLSAPEADLVARWFWATSLGELYGSSTETRIARDVLEILDWLEGGEEPRSIREASFRQARLDQLRGRVSAGYKAIHALLMGRGCYDFVTGAPLDLSTVHNEAIDIHHIFPKAWCEKQGLDWRQYDSIVNKTALTARSNRLIGGQAPSRYLSALRDNQGLSDEAQDAILRSHLIDPEHLQADDFHAFYEARREALTELIEQEMTNPVIRDVIPEDEPEFESVDEEAADREDAA
ncbi:DUF262 domain-containing protein [Jannaschia sp. W003]|uniref:DUF262 domain-containing protein n=1 Tax=Jannaschia sp. W003 TaxID=2867012 RepID=UPI0021A6CE3D|nr:DUF262 domain-containing protein [Jannaschia sp. W003]UWQ21654.1 DUF262 domain-containing protein [Jannaschia sp. W003]